MTVFLFIFILVPKPKVGIQDERRIELCIPVVGNLS